MKLLLTLLFIILIAFITPIFNKIMKIKNSNLTGIYYYRRTPMGRIVMCKKKEKDNVVIIKKATADDIKILKLYQNKFYRKYFK